MIQRLESGDDIMLQLVPVSNKDEVLDYKEFEDYKIKLYTKDINNAVEPDADTIENFILKVPSQAIAQLESGVIHAQIEIGLIDPDYPDGRRTIIKTYDTDYYKL